MIVWISSELFSDHMHTAFRKSSYKGVSFTAYVSGGVPYPLLRCHGLETGTTSHRVLGPRSRPLRLVGTDRLFKRFVVCSNPACAKDD